MFALTHTGGSSMDRPFMTCAGRARSGRSPLLRQLMLPWLAFLLAMQTACMSPEASRSRGGGPGADVGNHGVPIRFHDGAEPYHDTPCVTEPVKCEGPMPMYGASSTPD